MTQLEIILILTVVIAVTWSGIITVYAIKKIGIAKEWVEYYRHPVIQKEIAHHVIKNRWYSEGGEVYR